jgi:hypothetical protein
MNTNQPKKEQIGSIIQKFPQKAIAQRTAKGPISISEYCLNGDYIVLENTSKRLDTSMHNWQLTHCVDSVRKTTFKFPENFCIKSKQCIKLWSKNKDNLCKIGEDDLIASDVDNWTCGSKDTFIRLENEYGEEKAVFKKSI